jgi:hypothetical protein
MSEAEWDARSGPDAPNPKRVTSAFADPPLTVIPAGALSRGEPGPRKSPRGVVDAARGCPIERWPRRLGPGYAGCAVIQG